MEGQDVRLRRAAEEPLDVEVELVKERAEALGRAGRTLEDAVAAYRLAAAAPDPVPAEVREALLDDIAGPLYRLVVQRECSGARHGNLEAIRLAYGVPEAAFLRI